MNRQDSLLERTIGGFSRAVAALGALFAIPWFAGQFRLEVLDYLHTSFTYQWAFWGSWLFIALMGAVSFFGIAALFQIGLQLLFRGRSYRDGI